MAKTKSPIQAVTIGASRPTEYTSWRPRLERGHAWTIFIVGPFRVMVHR